MIEYQSNPLAASPEDLSLPHPQIPKGSHTSPTPAASCTLKSNPYSLAASRVTFGFKNICVSGLAINPNTVTTGQVKTRVCLRGNSPTTSHHRSNFFSNCPLPCKKIIKPLRKQPRT